MRPVLAALTYFLARLPPVLFGVPLLALGVALVCSSLRSLLGTGLNQPPTRMFFGGLVTIGVGSLGLVGAIKLRRAAWARWICVLFCGTFLLWSVLLLVGADMGFLTGPVVGTPSLLGLVCSIRVLRNPVGA